MLDSDVLSVGDVARAIAGGIDTSEAPIPGPVLSWYGKMTAYLLPERFRIAFDFPLAPRTERIARASMATLGRAYRGLPPVLRYVPMYHAARARVSPRSPLARARARITRSGFGIWPEVR